MKEHDSDAAEPAEHDEAEVHEHEEHEEHHEAEHHEESHSSSSKGFKNKLKSYWAWCGAHKKVSIPVGTVVVLLLLMIIPFTRYAITGLFLKQDFPVIVIDSETSKPVTRAQITINGVSAFTDSAGKAKVHVSVGNAELKVDKLYYKTVTQGVTVTILKPDTAYSVKLQATGRQVPVTVTNKITKKAVKGAIVSANGAQTQTDEKGEAILIVPVGKTEATAKIVTKGYNTSEVTVKVTTQADPANSFTITPAGKIYFLSNQSGKIDVVKTNLDGSERQVVLAGTGKETPYDTSLLASQDWKYLALWSKRDGGDNPKIFLIDTTANDQLTTMDEGKASFVLAGWDGYRFIYTVSRQTVSAWQPKQQALKSFDAVSKKIDTLDETTAAGAQSSWVGESFGTVSILANGQIVYIKNWQSSYDYTAQQIMATKQATLNTVNPDGTSRKAVQGFGMAPGTQTGAIYIDTRPYEANGLYVHHSNGQKELFYKYEDNAVAEDKTLTSDAFYSLPYNAYLVSPSNSQTFWSESRDGKNTFFVGDKDGEHGKQILTGSALTAFGWFTDDYLLASKGGNELYIMPIGGVSKDDQALKVSDYYHPSVSYYGYGKGYGGY